MPTPFYFPVIFSVLTILLQPLLSSSITIHTHLKRGSSLSVEKPDHFFISPNGTFIAGFHQVGGNAYCFAIWFNDPSCPSNCTKVWVANRDTPVNGKRSELSFQRTGNLVLTDASGLVVWSTNTNINSSVTPSSLRLLDTGNLVLVGKTGRVLWQSFDSPTDTLLPLQALTRYKALVSSRSRGDISSGFYKLSFDERNVLAIVYDGPESSSMFWPVGHSTLIGDVGRTSYNNNRIAVLDELGMFSSSDNFSFSAADYGSGQFQRRLTLDFDGNLRLYSRERGSRSKWVVSSQAIIDSCKIHGACGPNSVCSYIPRFGRKTCSCLPGYARKRGVDWSHGCRPVFNVSCVDYHQNDVTYLRLPHIESDGYDFQNLYQNTSLDQCKEVCSKRCDCKGFQLRSVYRNYPTNYPYCFLKTQLFNGYRVPNFEGILHVKVPKSHLNFSETLHIQENNLDCVASSNGKILERKYDNNHHSWSLKFLMWFVGLIGIVEILGMSLVWLLLIRTNRSDDERAQVFQLADIGFKRFTYAELKKATRNFKEEIGSGASGIVYKGSLSNGRVAAIKRLRESEQGEAEFLAEVNTIGALNHMHLIDMWGYCAEGKHRMLVYEYMEHGSLAQNLSSNTLDWQNRFQIAVGAAKGLAYLHEECLEWVLHCDLKPQNILLDSDNQPKLSDFGLSKLINRGAFAKASFSTMRGTRGYMAPEWVYCLAITSKVDVYSYGVVVLEMITGMSPFGVPNPGRDGVAEPRRLVSWVRDQKKKIAGQGRSWIEGIVDPIIASSCEIDEIELLINVALKCVEEDMNLRPTMGQVVEMLRSGKL